MKNNIYLIFVACLVASLSLMTFALLWFEYYKGQRYLALCIFLAGAAILFFGWRFLEMGKDFLSVFGDAMSEDCAVDSPSSALKDRVDRHRKDIDALQKRMGNVESGVRCLGYMCDDIRTQMDALSSSDEGSSTHWVQSAQVTMRPTPSFIEGQRLEVQGRTVFFSLKSKGAHGYGVLQGDGVCYSVKDTDTCTNLMGKTFSINRNI